jgi:hypothetical protein
VWNLALELVQSGLIGSSAGVSKTEFSINGLEGFSLEKFKGENVDGWLPSYIKGIPIKMLIIEHWSVLLRAYRYRLLWISVITVLAKYCLKIHGYQPKYRHVTAKMSVHG